MLSLNSLLLFSEAPKKLVDFYRQVLAREPKFQEGEFSGFEVGACALVIGPHSEVHGRNKIRKEPCLISKLTMSRASLSG